MKEQIEQAEQTAELLDSHLHQIYKLSIDKKNDALLILMEQARARLTKIRNVLSGLEHV